VRAEGPTAAEAAANEVEEEADFDLLSTKVADLVAHMDDELKGCSIYLVGMMGSGKSTLGERNRDGPG
jgi:shikimate kinase